MGLTPEQIREAKSWFDQDIPNTSFLRKAYPEICDLLKGEFAEGDHNYYERLPSGIIVSRELLQEKEKNPTAGRIFRFSEGSLDFELTSGYTETLMVLKGQLRASVRTKEMPKDFKEEESILRKFGTIIAPYGTILRLQPETNDVDYLCMYKRII